MYLSNDLEKKKESIELGHFVSKLNRRNTITKFNWHHVNVFTIHSE